MAGDTYVVVGSQLNRRVKNEDGDWEPANITRGTEFSAGETFADGDPGVTDKEIRRWLSLAPKMLVSKADLEKAQAVASDQSALIADLQAQLAEANAKVAAAVAQGADLGAGEGTGGGLEEPAGNASADEWRAYARQQEPDESKHSEIGEATRDDLRKQYGSN